MRCLPNAPQACLLVQGAGGGKSAACQSVGTVDAGIILVIEPTLSLGADQASKISSATSEHGDVDAYQLDSLKSNKSKNTLYQCLRSITSDSNETIFLFSSPEEILRPPWTSLILHLLNKKKS